MHAKLRSFHSPDVRDLASYSPDEPTKFGFFVELLVGADDGPGEESFGVIVCTAAWLAERYARDNVVSLRNHFLMNEYRYEYLDRDLRKFVETVDGATWEEVATKVSRLGHWEFEDYRE